MRVLLVNMPFASVVRPALGVSLLKAALRQAGHECDVIYPNVAFARILGVADYERIAVDLPHPMLIGEWVFTDALYDGRVHPRTGYVRTLLDRGSLSARDGELVLTAREHAPWLLDRCMRDVSWDDYDLVGFTSTSAQNVAALALAARIKAAHPRIGVAFGGSNWDEGMGRELHRRFEFVDFALSGEADESLPALVDRLSRGRDPDLAGIPGILFRRAGETVSTGPARPVTALDELPYPDFTDYFDALRANGLLRAVRPAVLAETCRGCWWASRHPCLFCGSPGCRRTYREKSASRVLEEMRALVETYPCASIELVDDVPSPAFFNRVLPALAADPLDVPMFCEVRPDVTEAEIALLSAARASIQPGIESLDDHILRLMCKGSRALENIRLLRWCRDHNVSASWNLIYRVPGETSEDYEHMLALLPALRSLDPPSGCGPVRLDRFSSYAEHPERYGLGRLEALSAYSFLYPFPDSSLRRIAYAFEWPPDGPPSTIPRQRLLDEIEEWRAVHDKGVGNPRPARSVGSLGRFVLRASSSICSHQDLFAAATECFPDRGSLEAELEEALSALLGGGALIKDGDRYLTIATISAADETPGS